MSRKRKELPPDVQVHVDGMAGDGRGMVVQSPRPLLVDNALPGEEVVVRYTRVRGRVREGVAQRILTRSPDRVTPRCLHFLDCGGCSLQHLEPKAQVQRKEQILVDEIA